MSVETLFVQPMCLITDAYFKNSLALPTISLNETSFYWFGLPKQDSYYPVYSRENV